MRKLRVTSTDLNRSLLARQGLLERLQLPLVEAVESIGALQAQHWPALPVALWSRVAGFAVADLHAALERGELVAGTLLRGTLHLISASEHRDYATVVAASGADDWKRTKAERTPEVAELRGELLAFAADEARSQDELADFVERWLKEHPDAIDAAEADKQRQSNWRPFLTWSALVRAPEGGKWGAKAPAARRAAPQPPAGEDALEDALEAVVRRHLGAFGPAGADDIAAWIGFRVPPVRAALERLSSELVELEDEDGRALHDLAGAPRPDAEVEAPPRFLAAFDSVLLAYAGKRRARIIPDALRDAVYGRANLQIRPSFTVDGVVAGTWSVDGRKREATLTLAPGKKLPRAARAALEQEGEELLRFLRPDAGAHRVAVDS